MKRVEELEAQVRELLARLNQNSSNSHQPPSADPPSAPKPTAKKPTGRRPGGQPGHPGHWRKRLPPDRIDRFEHYHPVECGHCRAPLSREASPADPPPQWHQVFDLPEITAVVTEHQGHARRCSCCGRITRAEIPAEVLSHGIGPKLAAVMSYLSGRCHDGRRTVEEIVEDLFGVPVSLGTVSNYEAQMSDALGGAYEQARLAVRSASAKNVDETSWKQAGQMRWLWGAAAETVAAFGVYRGRNWKSFCKLLGAKVKGIVCSDRWTSYNHVPLRRRQLCWSHLKRDFQKWVDKGEPTRLLGEDGLKICRQVFGGWRNYREGKASRKELQEEMEPVRRRMREILQWGLGCGDVKAAGFCRNVMGLEGAMWTFVRVEGVEPTNNHAERILRQGVLWRKNSFGSHSEEGCRFVERMLTVVQTLRLQGRKVLAFLDQTLQAHRADRAPPALVG
jgi:transposase